MTCYQTGLAAAFGLSFLVCLKTELKILLVVV
jgi:hypothetical protein